MEETIRMTEAHQPRNEKETRQFYEQWVDQYEEDIQVDGYNGPAITAKFALRFLKPTDKILDVCGGTGLVAQGLKSSGGTWNSIDVIDGSPQMLKKAKNKGVYRNYYCEFVKREGSSIPSGAYDAVTLCGGFSPGHMDETHLREIARYVRKCGLVILAGRKKWLEGGLKESHGWNGEVEKGMLKLEKEGVWELVAREQKDNYCGTDPGLYFVWRKI